MCACVQAVAVEPRGRFCVTAGADGSARVWSLATAACALIVQDSADNGLPGLHHCRHCLSTCFVHVF